MARAYRARRSCLSVPASSQRFIDKARGTGADEVFLDLEDAVAPGAKAQARANAVAALAPDGEGGDWGDRVLGVRVNDATTGWAHRDVIEVVASGGRLDAIVLPKVSSPDHVIWLDLLLGQAEREAGLPPGRIAIEAQIEDAAGLAAVEAVAAASTRLEALVFGPGDFTASIGIRSLEVGAQPEGYAGDAFHYPLMRILVAARAYGLQAIDGPYVRIRDTDGFRRSATSSAALGFDGKWVLHPDQIAAANEVFAPSQADFDRARSIIEAYDRATTVEARGAVMLGDEMIDEASRKMAESVVTKGRAAGMA